MNLERMERLIVVLEGVQAANKAFNLTHWIETEADLREYDASEGGPDACTTVGSFGESCGTACCALGYAGLDPEFQAQGLKLVGIAFRKIDNHTVEREIGSTAEFNAFANDRTMLGHSASPEFGGYDGFDAGAAFFGIGENAARFIFGPDNYARADFRPILPAEVIERVREVMALGGSAPRDWFSRASDEVAAAE